MILEKIIFLESIRFWAHGGGVDGGEASLSSKKLIIGNPEFRFDFSLTFLDEFLYDFAGTFFAIWFMVRSCEISIFR